MLSDEERAGEAGPTAMSKFTEATRVPVAVGPRLDRRVVGLEPERTGVGEWCAPGPAAKQVRRWMLTFDDADRGYCLYEDEQQARDAFARCEGLGWNCYLWELSPRSKPHNAEFTGADRRPVE